MKGLKCGLQLRCCCCSGGCTSGEDCVGQKAMAAPVWLRMSVKNSTMLEVYSIPQAITCPDPGVQRLPQGCMTGFSKTCCCVQAGFRMF